MTTIPQQQAHWLIFQNDALVVWRDSEGLPNDQDIVAIKPYLIRQFSLGLWNNVDYYCAEIDQGCSISEGLQTLPLRQALAILQDETYSLGVKAHSVLTWDKNHRFCGRCGGHTAHQHKGFERTCPECELSFFPRISPSIIVLIKKGDHLLMARSPHFLPGVYGLIAGFVEPGERLEETVHREVLEEVGIQIKNLVYACSQPWPFPDSLMIAFTADYAGGEIVIDDDEIEAAGWYKYDDLPGRPSVATSVAAKLIDAFVASFEHHEADVI
ncbi:MAG: NAD(+) diphosphatase [Legionella sp.]|nr:MAG: NAD(+) diphosphatase [Legionella sp.]